MKNSYLAGIDVGTTGARCCLFDLHGNKVSSSYREYASTYPQPGWVEQNGNEIIKTVMQVCREAIAASSIDARLISSIGFSAQRSSVCPVDKGGDLTRPIISWQDGRTGAQLARMRELISDVEYYELSGLPPAVTWIVSKVLWMRENEREIYNATARFVQVHDLILRAFGADDFYTDICEMAFYGLWDTKNRCWSRRLLETFNLDPELFGRPTAPGTKLGKISNSVAELSGFAAGTPFCVGAGDQNCALIGMGAIDPGMATVTLGTAGLAILSTDKFLPGFGGMMITNHVLDNMWEIEGLSNAAASSLRWFRDEIAQHEKFLSRQSGTNVYELLDKAAATAGPGANGLLFMPYLAAAATPRWNNNARGAFLGLSFAHRREHLVRAVMEGVVMEIRDIMQQWLDHDMDVEVVRIGGGAANSALWSRIQADVYNRPVQLVREKESTVLGAAIIGAVGAGVFSSIREGVEKLVEVTAEINPDPRNRRIYDDIYGAYASAYEAMDNHKVFDKIAKIQQNGE